MSLSKEEQLQLFKPLWELLGVTNFDSELYVQHMMGDWGDAQRFMLYWPSRQLVRLSYTYIPRDNWVTVDRALLLKQLLLGEDA